MRDPSILNERHKCREVILIGAQALKLLVHAWVPDNFESLFKNTNENYTFEKACSTLLLNSA